MVSTWGVAPNTYNNIACLQGMSAQQLCASSGCQPFTFFFLEGKGTGSSSSSAITSMSCDAITFAVIQRLNISNAYFVIISKLAILYLSRNAVNWQASNLIGAPVFWCRHNSLMLELPDPFPSPAPKKKKVKGQ
jgi:hypothetical protein